MPTYPFRYVWQRPHRSLGLGLVLCLPWCSGHCNLWSYCLCQDLWFTVDISTTALLGVLFLHSCLSPRCVQTTSTPRGWFVYSSGGIQCNLLPSHCVPCGSDTVLGSEREEQGGVSTHGAPVLPVAPTSSPFCTLRQKLSSEGPAPQAP